MHEYEGKSKRKSVGVAEPQEKRSMPGLSNQALLAYLGASQKQHVADEDGIRQKLAERFEVNFGGLKVMRDPALEPLQEFAYTKGNEIYLSPAVDVFSSEGTRILAHEAAHVIQQGSAQRGDGILSSPSLETQANAAAAGSGGMEVSNFSMPSAAGAPVQGFMDFIFNRKKRKAAQIISGTQQNTPKHVRGLGQRLASHGLGGSAEFSHSAHGAMFAGALARGRTPQREGATFSELEREIVGLPRERLSPDASKLYGISQEELDSMAQLDEGAWEGFLGKSNRAAEIAAQKDWTGMPDKQFLDEYPLLQGLSRVSVAAVQGSAKMGMDRQLQSDPRNRELMGEFDDAAPMMSALMAYADLRAKAIAGKGPPPEELIAGITERARDLQAALFANKEERRRTPAPAAAPAPVATVPQQPTPQPTPAPAVQQPHTPRLPPLGFHRRRG